MDRLRGIVLCSLILVTFGGTPAGHAQELLFPPFFSCEENGDGRSFRALGPIVEFSGTTAAVRPLYYRDRPERTTFFLYPLGKDTPGHAHFIPFMRARKDRDHPTFDLFPYFSGTWEGTTYRGIFPIHGRMYNRYGLDEASFLLWPLYSRTVSSGEVTHSFLWPVFSWRQGAMFKVFPLYGHEDDAASRYTFFLWPVFHHERGTDRSMVAALPLFRYEHGPASFSASFLWPLFTYNRDDGSGHRSADFPWPLVRSASGGYEETRFFPLYWERNEGPVYRFRSVLWPLWTRSSSGGPAGEQERVTSVLILNRLTEKTTRDGIMSGSLTIWPLAHFSRHDGQRAWYAPAVLPFYSLEGFDNTWGEILTLARGSTAEGSARVSILWRSLYWERDAGTTRWSFLFLASRSSSPGYSQWGFLGNLFRFGGSRDQPPGDVSP